MAPSEFELRAALHDGEGEGVNAGRVIARARAVRATRRTRWATAAASVAVVGALGTGIGALAHYGGSESAGSASSAGGANAADSAAGAEAGAPAGAAAPQPVAPSADGAKAPSHGLTQGGFGSEMGMCPPEPPSVRVPEPGSPGTSGPLFTRRVTSVTVCGFRAKRAGGSPVFEKGVVLTTAPARQLADSLDAASSEFHEVPCPPEQYATRLVVYARSGAHRAAPVLVDLACGVSLTNGAAARYDWTPPADLAAKLDALTRP